MKHRYVVVEGPIGSGKSTLARLLAEHYSAELVLEDPGANPFLPQFSRDMKRHAVAPQMFFLFQRVNQLAAIRQPDLFEKKVIADYLLAKDQLFAKLTLDDNEFTLHAALQSSAAASPCAGSGDLSAGLCAKLDGAHSAARTTDGKKHRRGLHDAVVGSLHPPLLSLC